MTRQAAPLMIKFATTVVNPDTFPKIASVPQLFVARVVKKATSLDTVELLIRKYRTTPIPRSTLLMAILQFTLQSGVLLAVNEATSPRTVPVPTLIHGVLTAGRRATFQRIAQKKNKKPNVSTAEKQDTKAQNALNKEKCATVVVVPITLQ